jgi:hypothetical protein
MTSDALIYYSGRQPPLSASIPNADLPAFSVVAGLHTKAFHPWCILLCGRVPSPDRHHLKQFAGVGFRCFGNCDS